jgi:hypothetical protein
VKIATAPSHGTAIPQSDGSILYTPTAGYSGTDTFTYTVEDTNGETSAPGTVTIAINLPTPPVAGTVTGTAVAGVPVSLNVLSSDSATAPATLVPADVKVVTGPAHGTAIPQADGTILFTAIAGYFGPDSFTYTVEDTRHSVSTPGMVNITVSLPPIPVAGAVSTATFANNAVTIDALSSDSATAPATLVPTDVKIATAPSHGTAIPQSDGSILYTPTTGYSGSDTFTYTVEDTNGETSAPGTVNIAINLPTPPVAGTVTGTAVAGVPVSLDVLSTDSATAPATLVPADVKVVTGPSHGTAIAQPDGSILYTPTIGYTGTDSFTYTVQDSYGETSSPGTANIIVALPLPPTAGAVSAATSAAAPVSINVLSSDSTPQASLNPASVMVVTQPTHGTAVPQPDGSILYTPVAKFSGSDSFTYTVSDTLGDVSNPATVSITIAAGIPPVAPTVTAPAIGGQNNTIDVLANASGGAPLVPSSVTIVTQPAGGAATVNTSTGAISYVPKAGFVGTDTFTYTVANVNGATSAPATVSVDVGTTISSVKGAAHSLTFVDAAGGLETITLNKGSTQLFFSGSGGSVAVGKTGKAVVTGTNLELTGITLSDTTAASVLSIRGPMKAPVNIGGLTDDSPVRSILAPQANLSGTISIAGLGQLTVNSISNATIGIGAMGTSRFSLTAGAISNTSLYSAIPIGTLKAASWIGQNAADSITINGSSTDIAPGGIKAPSISTLSIAGSFNPDITLTAGGKSVALNSARITGAVTGGLWTIPGPTNSVTVGSITGWQGSFGTLNAMTVRAGGLGGAGSPALTATAIGSLTITGNLTTAISASSARLIHVNGSIADSSLNIAGTLSQLYASGSLLDAAISTGGNLTSLTTAAMSGSTVKAGVASTVSLATATADGLGSATIGSIHLTGRSAGEFTNSQILAGKITSASLGSVTTANGGIAFGLAVKTIGSFSGIFAGKSLSVPRADLSTEALLAAYVRLRGTAVGDFEIKITG